MTAVRKPSFFHRMHAPALACALLLGGQALLPAVQAQGARAGVQSDYIVAVVNSEPVTNHEIIVRVARIRAQLAARPNGEMPPHDMLVREVLERTIVEKAQLQAAREMGIKVDVVIVSPLTRALETAVGCFGNFFL